MAAESDRNLDEQFQSIGRFDPFEAKRLLRCFEEAGLRFRIDPQSVIAPSRKWTRLHRYNFIEIFVHEEDYERAKRIIS
jgi:Putative prokaryotic signal transducing protein